MIPTNSNNLKSDSGCLAELFPIDDSVEFGKVLELSRLVRLRFFGCSLGQRLSAVPLFDASPTEIFSDPIDPILHLVLRSFRSFQTRSFRFLTRTLRRIFLARFLDLYFFLLLLLLLIRILSPFFRCFCRFTSSFRSFLLIRSIRPQCFQPLFSRCIRFTRFFWSFLRPFRRPLRSFHLLLRSIRILSRRLHECPILPLSRNILFLHWFRFLLLFDTYRNSGSASHSSFFLSFHCWRCWRWNWRWILKKCFFSAKELSRTCEIWKYKKSETEKKFRKLTFKFYQILENRNLNKNQIFSPAITDFFLINKRYQKQVKSFFFDFSSYSTISRTKKNKKDFRIFEKIIMEITEIFAKTKNFSKPNQSKI